MNVYRFTFPHFAVEWIEKYKNKYTFIEISGLLLEISWLTARDSVWGWIDSHLQSVIIVIKFIEPFALKSSSVSCCWISTRLFSNTCPIFKMGRFRRQLRDTSNVPYHHSYPLLSTCKIVCIASESIFWELIWKLHFRTHSLGLFFSTQQIAI